MGKNEVEYTDPVEKKHNLLPRLNSKVIIIKDSNMLTLNPSVMSDLRKLCDATKDTDAEDTPKEASNEVSNTSPQTSERKAKRRNSKKR